jgi:alpha-galactosidase
MRILLLAAFIALGAAGADINGAWILANPRGDLILTIQASGTTFTGTMTGGMGPAAVEQGRMDGDKIEFVTVARRFGGEMRIPYKGTLEGDTMRLTMEFPAGTGPGGSARPGGPRIIVARRGTPGELARIEAARPKPLPLPELRTLPWNGLAKTPPMGWNSWNRFRTHISDKLIREVAGAMAANGMRDAGYRYIVIDDGWQGKRDAKGVLQPNERFPDMKALAGYVHSKGMLIGIYSSPGHRTCGGFEGSHGHEQQDAETWAAWGIDYLKYDWCGARQIYPEEAMQAVYQKMAEALRKTGRPIVYGICQYGENEVQKWAPAAGGNLWRTTFDIRPTWESISSIGFRQHEFAAYAKPGHWNDPDMLEVGNEGLTIEEQKTHFSLWAILAAPLLAGNDVREMKPEVREILLNREVIAINQDPLGLQARRIAQDGATEVWVKQLRRNGLAIALFNRGDAPAPIGVRWKQAGVSGRRTIRDVWRRTTVANRGDTFESEVPAHGVILLRVD